MSAALPIPRAPGLLSGREHLLTLLLSAMETEPLALVSGPRGSGKTTLLRHAGRRLQDRGGDPSGRPLLHFEIPHGTTLEQWTTQLLAALDDSAEGSGGLVPVILALNRRPAVVVIDSLDAFPPEDRHSLLADLALRIHASTLVIALTESLPADLAMELDGVHLPLPPLDPADGNHLFQQTLTRAGGQCPVETPPEILSFSRGNPAVIKHLARLYLRDPDRCRELARRSAVPRDAGMDFRIGPDGGLEPESLQLLRVLTRLELPVPESLLREWCRKQGSEAALDRIGRLHLLERTGQGAIRVALPAAALPDDEENVRQLALDLLNRLVSSACEHANRVRLPEDFGRDLTAPPADPAATEAMFRILYLRLEEDHPQPDIIARHVTRLARWLYLVAGIGRFPQLFRVLTASGWPGLDSDAEGAMLILMALTSLGYLDEAGRLQSMIPRLSSDHPLHGMQQLLTGSLRMKRGDLTAGLETLRSCREDPVPGIRAAALFHSVTCCMGLRRWQDADQDIAAGIQLTRDEGFCQLEIEFRLQQAMRQLRDGHPDQAREQLARLSERADELQCRPEQRADIRLQLAHSQFQLSRYDQSADSATSAMTIYMELGMLEHYHRALAARAKALSFLGRAGEALADFRRALEFARETGNSALERLLELRVSEACFASGDLPAALQHVEQAIAAFREAGDGDNLTRAYINLAVIYYTMHKFQDALEVCHAARQTCPDRSADDKPGQRPWPQIDYVLAELHLALDQLDKARTLFTILAATYRENGDVIKEVLCLTYLGDCYFRQGDYTKATEILEKSVALSLRRGAHLHDLYNHLLLLLALATRQDLIRFAAARTEMNSTGLSYCPQRIPVLDSMAHRLDEACRTGCTPQIISGLQDEAVHLEWNRQRIKWLQTLASLEERRETPRVGTPAADSPVSPSVQRIFIARRNAPSFQPFPGERLQELRDQAEQTGWWLDFSAGRFLRHGQEISLTRKRTLLQLLLALAENPGVLHSPAELFTRVWDEQFEAINAPVIHVNIRRLRKLLEPDWENPSLILTRYGTDGESGYLLSSKEDVVIVLDGES